MAIDFSFPEWLTRQHSFADSLLKGAQVGSIIANNRYRNQALAAQAIQAERDYDLREKQLNAQIKTEDINYQLKSQLIEDQAADKAAISNWVQQRNQLGPEERLGMEVPQLRLAQSYQIANQIVDNDTRTYSMTEKAMNAARFETRLRQLPLDYQYQFDNTQDPDERHAILKAGEAEMERQAIALRAVAPTIAAQARVEVAEVSAATREHLATMRAQATTEKTQGVSEAQFVNRHLNSVLDQLSFDRLHQKDTIEQKTKLATELLQNTYRDSGLATEVNPARKPAPSIGEIRQGYEYQGGDPSDKNSWKKVQ